MVNNLSESNTNTENENETSSISNGYEQAAIATKKLNFFEKLQLKWGVESLFQVFLILLTFTLTGSTVVFLKNNLYNALGFTKDTTWWVRTGTYLIFVFPTYQVLILVYGSLLGQFNFFWEKEKKLGRAILKLFKKRQK